jgi:hypothetical protein
MLMKIYIPRITLVFSVMLVLALAISACSTQQAEEVVQEDAPVQTEEVMPTIEQLGTEAPAELLETEAQVEEPVNEPSAEDSEEIEGYPAPGYQFPTPTTDDGAYPSPEQGGVPPVKTGLVATDPSSVVLATGTPQLVEFFAFW